MENARIDILQVILSVLGGLVLFLYSVSNLGDVIQQIAGDKSKEWILKFTKNIFTALLTGIVVTAILDSSSAVIIITIVLVNSSVLTFRQAMGIVMGANIGTTVSSQIIALDIGKYSPVLLAVGLLAMFFSNNERISKTGKIVLFFGMLFFGLYTMERAVEPLRNHEDFLTWMHGLENPARGAFIGAIVTLIVQSSSATVGMAITLAKKSLITLPAGIAVMIGAELGTCSDTLLATIKGKRAAIKTGLFHFLFNLGSVIIGLLLFKPFVNLILKISSNASLQQKIANAHILFNFMGVLIFMAFIPFFEKMLNKLLPDKQ
jgi:phosphate:Na+ symporter